MNDSTATYGHITLDGAQLHPAAVTDLVDGRYSVRLTNYSEPMMVYVEGTLDELAAFVLQLAGVVRELNARELTVSEFDGTSAPKRWPVNGLRVQR